MNEHYEDLMTEFALGIISESNQKELNSFLEKASTDEKKQAQRLFNAALSLNTVTEEFELNKNVKKDIFSKFENTSEHPAKTKSNAFIQLRPVQFFTSIAATILLTIYLTLSFSTEKANPTQTLTKADLAQFAHLKEVEDIALCSHVKELQMKQVDTKIFTAGKLYLNESDQSLVLHICHLPKLAHSEYFTLWSIGKDGSLKAIRNIIKRDGIDEQNFTLTKGAVLVNDMNFAVSVEKQADYKPVHPSKEILLKS